VVAHALSELAGYLRRVGRRMGCRLLRTLAAGARGERDREAQAGQEPGE